MATSTERMRALRARRAAGLVPIDGQAPLPLADRLGPAVEETLAALQLDPRDGAAAQVARQYARVIDRASDQAYALRHVGPLLLEALVALGATPAARARVPAGKPERAAPGRLAQLRAAHTQRPGSA